MTAHKKLFDRLPNGVQKPTRLLVHYHNRWLFKAAAWGLPIGLMIVLWESFITALAKVISVPIDWVIDVGEPESWTVLETGLYALGLYITILLFGALVDWVLHRVFNTIELEIINKIPGLRYIWHMLRKAVRTLIDKLERKNEDKEAGSFEFVGGFRDGVNTFKVLPITSVGKQASALWDPSAPAPTNGETFLVPNDRITVLPGVVPGEVSAKICATGIGLSTEADLFLRLEKEGEHLLSNLIAKKVIYVTEKAPQPGRAEA